MRVLFIARSTVFDGKSSLANVPRQMVHRMLLEDPSLTITWLVPKTADDTLLHEFLIAPLPDAVKPRLTFVKATGHGTDRMVGYFSTEEIWDQLNQARTVKPYDLVLTQQAPLVPAYKAILTNKMMSSRYNTTTPWVIWHLWTATLSQMEEVPEYYMGEADVAAELMGAVHADLNIWESRYLMQDAVKSLRKWFQPTMVKKVLASSEPVHLGVQIDKMDEVFAVREDRAVGESPAGPRLIWAGRYANQKKPRTSFEQMRKVQLELQAEGFPVEVVISSAQPTPDWAVKSYHDWQLYERQNRDGWLRVAGLGDVVLCNSVSESYGHTWVEMLAAGMIVVFERSWWSDELLPDWYPFIADTKAEQVAMAKAVLKDWPNGNLWTEYVPRVRQWIRENESDLASAPRMLGLLREQLAGAIEADAAIGRGSVGQLAHKAALAAMEAHGPVVSEEQVYAYMGQVSDSERDWGRHGDPISRVYLRRGLQGNGWVDLGGPEVTFTRAEGAGE